MFFFFSCLYDDVFRACAQDIRKKMSVELINDLHMLMICRLFFFLSLSSLICNQGIEIKRTSKLLFRRIRHKVAFVDANNCCACDLKKTHSQLYTKCIHLTLELIKKCTLCRLCAVSISVSMNQFDVAPAQNTLNFFLHNAQAQ